MRLKSHSVLCPQLEAWATYWRKLSRVVQFPERGCVKKGYIFKSPSKIVFPFAREHEPRVLHLDDGDGLLVAPVLEGGRQAGLVVAEVDGDLDAGQAEVHLKDERTRELL